MANIDIAIGALGIALSMILWGIDRVWRENHPTFRRSVGGVYLAVGLFWLYIALVAATAP
jgi:hypothetical protein